MPDNIDPERLRILSDYAFKLVLMRQQECKHLIIENIGPRMLEKVVFAYRSTLLSPYELLADEMYRHPEFENPLDSVPRENASWVRFHDE